MQKPCPGLHPSNSMTYKTLLPTRFFHLRQIAITVYSKSSAPTGTIFLRISKNHSYALPKISGMYRRLYLLRRHVPPMRRRLSRRRRCLCPENLYPPGPGMRDGLHDRSRHDAARWQFHRSLLSALRRYLSRLRGRMLETCRHGYGTLSHLRRSLYALRGTMQRNGPSSIREVSKKTQPLTPDSAKTATPKETSGQPPCAVSAP